MKTSTVRRRLRGRGAALVEAAVVMPVLVIFLGLFAFTYREFSVKQDVMAQSRSEAFSNGFHAKCAGYGDIGNGIFPRITPPKVMGVSIPILSPIEYALDFTTATTTVEKSGVATAGGRSRGLSATSYVYCSPRSFGEIVRDAINTVLDGAKSLFRH